jgi:putative ABC transport system substrate-binding protein
VAQALAERGLATVLAEVTAAGGLERAVAELASARVDGVVVAGCPLFTSRRSELSRLFLTHRLPTISDVRDHVEAGGLVSYGSSLAGAYHGAGLYAGRILRGAAPSELPVIRPSVLEFALNQSTARALGLSVAPALLARVDTVVD